MNADACTLLLRYNQIIQSKSNEDIKTSIKYIQREMDVSREFMFVCIEIELKSGTMLQYNT